MSNFYKNLHGGFQTHIKKIKTNLWAQIIYDSYNKSNVFFFKNNKSNVLKFETNPRNCIA